MCGMEEKSYHKNPMFQSGFVFSGTKIMLHFPNSPFSYIHIYTLLILFEFRILFQLQLLLGCSFGSMLMSCKSRRRGDADCLLDLGSSVVLAGFSIVRFPDLLGSVREPD